jgi:hypothetical protein
MDALPIPRWSMISCYGKPLCSCWADTVSSLPPAQSTVTLNVLFSQLAWYMLNCAGFMCIQIVWRFTASAWLACCFLFFLFFFWVGPWRKFEVMAISSRQKHCVFPDWNNWGRNGLVGSLWISVQWMISRMCLVKKLAAAEVFYAAPQVHILRKEWLRLL